MTKMVLFDTAKNLLFNAKNLLTYGANRWLNI